MKVKSYYLEYKRIPIGQYDKENLPRRKIDTKLAKTILKKKNNIEEPTFMTSKHYKATIIKIIYSMGLTEAWTYKQYHEYFKEKANEYHVVAAGSLLGTLLARPKSYPVGMVNLLDIHPLGFDEFLDATDPALFGYYESIQKEQKIEDIFHNRLLDAYNNYLIIGGMPVMEKNMKRNR